MDVIDYFQLAEGKAIQIKNEVVDSVKKLGESGKFNWFPSSSAVINGTDIQYWITNIKGHTLFRLHRKAQ